MTDDRDAIDNSCEAQAALTANEQSVQQLRVLTLDEVKAVAGGPTIQNEP